MTFCSRHAVHCVRCLTDVIFGKLLYFEGRALYRPADPHRAFGNYIPFVAHT
jgi:hypothetical protein